MKIQLAHFFAVCVTMSITTGETLAAANYTGSIRGSFSNAVTTGSYIDWRKPGIFIADNNAADAVFSYNQTQGAAFNNFFQWGMPANNVGPSSLLFTGVNNFAPVAPGVDFTLGQLTYFNGTINVGTGTYGGSFTLSGLNITDNNGAAVAVDPLTVSFTNYDTVNYNTNALLPTVIANLINLGGGNAAAWTASDVVSADFFFIPSLGIYAFEKEGAGVTFDVKGRIVGDPMIDVTGLFLDPNSTNLGFILNPTQEQQIQAYDQATVVPVPASIWLFGSVMAGLSLLGNRRKA